MLIIAEMIALISMFLITIVIPVLLIYMLIDEIKRGKLYDEEYKKMSKEVEYLKNG